jgi:hypothetical protein
MLQKYDRMVTASAVTLLGNSRPSLHFTIQEAAKLNEAYQTKDWHGSVVAKQVTLRRVTVPGITWMLFSRQRQAGLSISMWAKVLNFGQGSAHGGKRGTYDFD